MIDFSKKKRIVVKVGTSSLTHKDTGYLDYLKIERLVMELCNLKNTGVNLVLVTSGAVATGRQTLDLKKADETVEKKQALASIGQARLMSLYEKFFFEFNQIPSQVLLTRSTVVGTKTFDNAVNTFNELFNMGVIPIVNANDTVSTFEIRFGDNDTLSAIVADIINADLLILLTDIDGLYTKNPYKEKDAEFISYVDKLTDIHFKMASGDSGSNLGTGGMKTKLRAAKIATAKGIDMIIASGGDMRIIGDIFKGDFKGTIFKNNPDPNFDMASFISEE